MAGLDFNPTPIADKGYDLVMSKGDATQRQDFVNILDLYSANNNDFTNQQDATNILEQQQLLPSLILENFDRLDRDHDGTVMPSEMVDTYYDPNSDSLDKLLASYASTGRVSLELNDPRFDKATVEHMVAASRPQEADTTHTYGTDGTQLTTTDQTAVNKYVPDQPWPDDVWKPADVVAEEQAKASTDLFSGTFDAVQTATDPKLAAIGVLQSDKSTPEQQLKAVQDLAAMNITTLTLTDKDGNPMNVRLAVSPIAEGSSKSYVHMFAVDESGNETIVLRAISDGQSFLHEHDKSGNDVGFIGTKWLANHTNSFFDAT